MKNNILQKNEIYNRQFAVLIFFSALIFKLSRLPRLVSVTIGNMVLMVELVLCIIDILLFILIYYYISINGFELSQKNCPIALKILLVLLLIIFTGKFILYYSSGATFIISSLFRSIAPYIIIVTFILPIFYLAYKGIVSIARTAEIFFILVIALLFFDYTFLHGEMDFDRLKPLFTMSVGDFTVNMNSFGLWIGDLLPFLFIKMKKHKFPYVALAVPVTYGFIILNIIISIAIFGGALFLIENILVIIPTFNEFASTLGKLEWAGLIPWFIMIVIYLSCLLWGCFEIGEFLFRKRTVFAGIYVGAIIIFLLSVKSMQYVINMATTQFVSIAFWCGNSILPLALLLVAIISKRKNEKQKIMPEKENAPILLNAPGKHEVTSSEIQEKNSVNSTTIVLPAPSNHGGEK
ncbi:MAG: GerAB/ArcD/ProY family transporter [Clostridia bacterium]|nr:GerAB/ArcD/ProY family transporter [Clostridia bacterium]